MYPAHTAICKYAFCRKKHRRKAGFTWNHRFCAARFLRWLVVVGNDANATPNSYRLESPPTRRKRQTPFVDAVHTSFTSLASFQSYGLRSKEGRSCHILCCAVLCPAIIIIISNINNRTVIITTTIISSSSLSSSSFLS